MVMSRANLVFVVHVNRVWWYIFVFVFGSVKKASESRKECEETGRSPASLRLNGIQCQEKRCVNIIGVNDHVPTIIFLRLRLASSSCSHQCRIKISLTTTTTRNMASIKIDLIPTLDVLEGDAPRSIIKWERNVDTAFMNFNPVITGRKTINDGINYQKAHSTRV